MLAISTTGWWVIGWAVGAAVIVVAALLLLTIIALGRRIVRQATEIVEALDGTRDHTLGLWDVVPVNHALDRITRRLAQVRERLEAA